MTPDPLVCLYQAVEVRNSDESLWLCVYTLESRKEGNQPRSAKSGEVRENSCSAPELQWFKSARQDLSHVISTAETFDQHKTATVTALSTSGKEKRQRRRQKQQEPVWNRAVLWGELNFLLNIFRQLLSNMGRFNSEAVVAFSSSDCQFWCHPKANKSFSRWGFSLIDFKARSMQHSRALTEVEIFLQLL